MTPNQFDITPNGPLRFALLSVNSLLPASPTRSWSFCTIFSKAWSTSSLRTYSWVICLWRCWCWAKSRLAAVSWRIRASPTLRSSSLSYLTSAAFAAFYAVMSLLNLLNYSCLNWVFSMVTWSSWCCFWATWAAARSSSARSLIMLSKVCVGHFWSGARALTWMTACFCTFRASYSA